MIREDVTGWASFVAIVLSIGSLVWGWLTSGGAKALVEARAIRDELREIDTRIARLENELAHVPKRDELRGLDARTVRLENELLHLPDREQTHRLELSIIELKGHIGGLDERLKPVAAISDRLQEFLLAQVTK
jgi:predicted  nucleic acid-binding Zn-ribbon protein